MVIARLALAHLARRWRAAVALGVLVSLPLFALTMVDGYTRGVDVLLDTSGTRLVVQRQGTVGQVVGSRMPRSVGEELRALGVAEPIPEIHAATGSTGRDAMLVAGVDVARYRELDPYRLIDGEFLSDSAPERTTLLGTYLADRLDAEPGDVIRIRGRNVRVVGVFESGLYLDDVALLPLADAQQLLGWGDEVSVFVVPADGPLTEGAELPGGLEVVARGDVAFLTGWDPVLDLLGWTVRLLALGAVLVLAAAVWRLVWLERAEVGLLRLLGFRRATVAVYVAAQSTVIVVGAAFVGVLGATTLGPHLSRTTLAVTTRPLIDGSVMLRALAVGCAVWAVALVVPLALLGRLRVRALLVRDD